MRLLVFNDPHRGFTPKTSRIHEEVFNKIDQSSFDAVLVCGDWGTAKTDHVRGAFKAFRKAFPDKPILGVLGNHDFWDPKNTIPVIEHYLERYAKESNIHLLDKNPIELGGVLFMGFNGWFFYPDPQQDVNPHVRRTHIRLHVAGMTTDDYFRKKAEESVDFILKYPTEGKKVVVASHFPCVEETMGNHVYHCGNPSHGEKLLSKADYMFFGHTHEKVDVTIGKTRVINVGSGYQEENHNIKEYFLYEIVEIK